MSICVRLAMAKHSAIASPRCSSRTTLHLIDPTSSQSRVKARLEQGREALRGLLLNDADWKYDLQSFFQERGERVSAGRVDKLALCYISGRNPNIWTDETVCQGLIESLVEQMQLDSEHSAS